MSQLPCQALGRNSGQSKQKSSLHEGPTSTEVRQIINSFINMQNVGQMEVSAKEKTAAGEGARQTNGSVAQGGLRGEKVKEARERATRYLGQSPAPGETGPCPVHMRKCKEARVPGARGAQEGCRDGMERAFFGFCSECDGRHWRTWSGGASRSGWWVGNRPWGPEWKEGGQSGGRYNSPSAARCGWDWGELGR